MLKNVKLANQETATIFGKLKFDAKGECRQLDAEQEKLFDKIRGFEVIVEKEAKKVVDEVKDKVAPKKSAPKAKDEAPKE